MSDSEKLEPSQLNLFESPEWWEEYWKGMPEFVQEDLQPLKSIIVHFEKREDVEAFSKLIDQPITMDTKSVWFPEADIDEVAHKRWYDVKPQGEDSK